MCHKGTNQQVRDTCFPISKPLCHQLRQLLSLGRNMNHTIPGTDIDHTIPIQFSAMLLIFADSVHDLLPQPADVVLCDGMVVGIVAAGDGIDNHAVILGFGIFKMIPHPLYRGSRTLNSGRGPGIQKNGIFHTPVCQKLLIERIQLRCLFPKCCQPGQVQLLTIQAQKRQFYAVSQSHIQFLLCTFDIGSCTIFQLLNGVPHRKYTSFLGLMIFYQNDWAL